MTDRPTKNDKIVPTSSVDSGLEAGSTWSAKPLTTTNRTPTRRAGNKANGRVLPTAQSVAAQKAELRRQLAEVRREFRTMAKQQALTSRELRSANQELQSANEELQSINEEMDCSREEMQSGYDELESTNDALLKLTSELTAENGELRSVLNSLQMAIVLVDGDMRIKRFTPDMHRMLDVMPGDVGRPLHHLNLVAACPDLATKMREVIDTGMAQNFKYQDQDGIRYCLRLVPYLGAQQEVEGAAIVTLDRD